MPSAPPKSQDEPRRVLTGAVMRASALLDITQSGLARILGLSASTISRMANGTYTLESDKKEWELAALFVRLFRSLDAVIGSNDSAARSWLTGEITGSAAAPSTSSAAQKAWFVSSNIWTQRAVGSEAFRAQRRLWRAVEAQHIASTLRLVANVEEQLLLERLLEQAKPPLPAEAGGPALFTGHSLPLFLARRLAFSRLRRLRDLVRRGGAAHGLRGTGVLAVAIPARQRRTRFPGPVSANRVQGGHRRASGGFDPLPVQAVSRRVDPPQRLLGDDQLCPCGAAGWGRRHSIRVGAGSAAWRRRGSIAARLLQTAAAAGAANVVSDRAAGPSRVASGGTDLRIRHETIGGDDAGGAPSRSLTLTAEECY